MTSTPEQHFPQDAYEMRKCARCKKLKPFVLGDKRAYCSDCLDYAKRYKRTHKVLKLSKADLAQIEKEARQKRELLKVKYGTDQTVCQNWRQMYELGQKSNEYYQHIDVCHSCQAWFAHHRKDALDLNGTKGTEKHEDFEELKAYGEVFSKPEREFQEDFVYHPSGAVMPMTRVCSTCGTPLDAKGRCPNCEPEG
jgi:hypothetical protein